MAEQTPFKAVYNVAEAAEYLGLAQSTLNKWRCHRNGGPAFVKLGKAVRYRKEELEAFGNEQTVRCVTKHGEADE